MRSKANIRQVREVFRWIADEAFSSISQDSACSRFPEYLPPVCLEDDAEVLIRRIGSTLRRVAEFHDRWLAAGYYEDHREASACCVVLMIELQRRTEEEKFWVEHTWLEEVGGLSVELLARSIDLSLHAQAHSITFEFRLPVYSDTIKTVQHQNTILLVEDDDFVRIVTREVLETGGHRVIEAGDAEEALRLFGRNRQAIGMVVSDVTMPGRTGQELAKRLHASAPKIPVLLMSGYATPARQDASRLMFFLEKPYNSEMLLEAVNRCLHARAAGGESIRHPSAVIESC